MDDLRVPTTSLPVEILCADGRAMLGDIFLPAQSSLQSGPMRPDEWSESPHPFFPFRSREAQALTILNRGEVVSLTVPAASNGAADDTCTDVPVMRIAVEAGGTRFEGDVLVDMPPGHQRVADWLNAPAAFFTVRAGSAHHLIQKRHVTRVVELRRVSS
jgi:hypothetical protein